MRHCWVIRKLCRPDRSPFRVSSRLCGGTARLAPCPSLSPGACGMKALYFVPGVCPPLEGPTVPGIEKRTISLPAAQASYIDALVEAGTYASASEVVRA